ncbi:MAG: hypothetical protein AAFX93_16425 [Verrucomicrobiota bacterium]
MAKPSAFKRMALLCLLTAAPVYVQAQPKLGVPSGWTSYNWATDNFNDTNLGWQWENFHGFYDWERSTRKNGQQTWTRFRTQNVVMDGSTMRIINWHHSSPITEWNPKIKANATFDYSGGVLASKADWLTEGQFQCYSKVQWKFADIWPTFWTDRWNGDELDIMQYQSNELDHSHVEKGTNPSQLSQRRWASWNMPAWEHNWAMARVTNWTHWAARTTRNTQAKFYINGTLEHTSSITRVDTGMEMLFTSSPHVSHLPAPGNYPSYYVDWVETHIP